VVARHVIQAVLFDLDGVVVFTDKYHYQGWKALCDEQGWDFDEEVNNLCRGVPRMASLEVILKHNNVTLPEDQKLERADHKNEYYKELLKNINDDDLYPGVVPFLEELKKRGVKLGLCSSSKNADTVLDALNLTHFFDAIVTGHDISNAKPHPEIFLLGAEKLGVHPFHCIVFEDAPSGIEAGLAAGMKCIGVGSAEVLPDASEVMQHYDEIDIDAMLDTGRKRGIMPEPWSVAETEINPKRTQYWESLLALTNGFMGLRGSYEEDDPELADYAYPGFFLNGIYDYEPYDHVLSFPGYPERRHVMLNLCDWRIINLIVDGQRFSLFSGQMSDYRRELDLKRGVVVRSLEWESPKGKRVRIRTTRLVSMTRRHSAAIHYEVTLVGWSGSVSFESVIRANVPSGELEENDNVTILKQDNDGKISSFLIKAKTAPLQFSAACTHQLNGATAPPDVQQKDDIVTERFDLNLADGQTIALTKHANFYTNIETSEDRLLDRAVEGVKQDLADGFDALLAEQVEFWKNSWDIADIEIDGNVADQQAMRFALFHLRQSHPEDDRRSISACGMTGDHYWGHVFWDTEMYMTPHFLYTQPKLLRPLLMYRYHLLDKARERARQMDGIGALYAWNSISGEECGIVYEAATAEYHLVSDIAYAIWRYTFATDDDEFLFNYGAEILFETARFLADRGTFIPQRDNKFCINVVCGPDEYGCGVNNNCYTNMLAQWHFHFACRVYDRMRKESPEILETLSERIAFKPEERDLWQRAADNMYIPFNEKLGIHEQDDSFLNLDPVDMSKIPLHVDLRADRHPLNLWRMQVAKQADVVLLMFVLGDLFSQDVKRANYAFYEPRTNHGSSLSTSIHAVLAGEIGRHEEAYAYFRHSAFMDLHDFKNNAAGGVHSACLGGTWMAAINGFAGLRDYESQLLFKPFLPAAWKGYRFQLAYRGRRIAVNVNTNEVTYTLRSGDAVSFTSAGASITLTPDRPVATAKLAPSVT